jgi:glycosyltransferase involved in cell wall biosynthesis
MSVQPTSVLFIASRGDIAGGEKYLLSVLRHLDRLSYAPIVVLPGSGAFKVALDALGVEALVLPANYTWLKPPQEWYPFLQGLPGRVNALADLMRQRGVALVHTNSNQILEGAMAAKLCGVHHVYLAHIEFQPDLPIFERFPMSQASFGALMAELSGRVIAVSNQVAESLQPNVAAEHLQVIHNGLELEAFDRAVTCKGDGFRQELSLGADDVLITAVGRIHPDKGFDLLVEAAAQVVAGAPNAHFAIVGGTDSEAYLAALKQRVAALGLGNWVHLVPFRNDVPDVLVQSDVFVLSSRREGHPFVLLEAMACGCPVVATRCGGVDETVVAGETGFTVPLGDVGALAAGIGELVAQAELRRRFGEAGSRRVREKFSAPRMVMALQDAYAELLGGAPPRPGSMAIQLFLQACSEFGYLGAELTALNDRVKRTERAADLIFDNPLAAVARRFKRRGDKR